MVSIQLPWVIFITFSSKPGWNRFKIYVKSDNIVLTIHFLLCYRHAMKYCVI